MQKSADGAFFFFSFEIFGSQSADRILEIKNLEGQSWTTSNFSNDFYK